MGFKGFHQFRQAKVVVQRGHCFLLPGGGDSELLLVFVSAVYLCNVFAVIVLPHCQPVSLPETMFAHLLTPVYRIPRGINATPQALTAAVHIWEKPTSPHVCFCIIMSAEILELTVLVWNGNWSTTAENRRIKYERCQSEAYTCVIGRLMLFFSVKCNARISLKPPTSSWVLHKLEVDVLFPFASNQCYWLRHTPISCNVKTIDRWCE